MTKDEALELALEALEDWCCGFPDLIQDMDTQAIAAIKEVLAQTQEPKIKTTDPFESSRVADYNRGWNDCLFASGIVKQTEQEPLSVEKILHLVDTHVGAPSISYPLDNSDWINFARAIEAAHNIKEL